MTSPCQLTEVPNFYKLRFSQVSYSYPRRVCPFGSRVTSLGQLTKVSDEHTIIEEISTLHDVPFGNLFQVQTKKVVKEIGPNKTHVQALVGKAPPLLALWRVPCFRPFAIASSSL